MKTVFLVIYFFSLIFFLNSCHDESRFNEFENRLAKLEISIDRFNKIVEENERIKSDQNVLIKKFDRIIEDIFINEFGSVEFLVKSFGTNSISSDLNMDLINKDIVRKVKFLYNSLTGYDIYKWELTSKGNSFLCLKEEEWNKNISDYEEIWYFNLGKSKLNGVNKVEYINSNQVKITYETIRVSKTELSHKDSFIGEITQYELELKKVGSNWVLKNSTYLNSSWIPVFSRNVTDTFSENVTGE